jgi:hypothetical protein
MPISSATHSRVRNLPECFVRKNKFKLYMHYIIEVPYVYQSYMMSAQSEHSEG